MTPQQIHDRIHADFSDAIVRFETENPDPYLVVKREHWLDVCRYVKATADLEFDFLESMSGVDDTEKLTLVSHLFSYKFKHSLVLKVEFAYDDLAIESVSSIWPAANWHEREQYDLFGFEFSNHPDLRRLLLPEDWLGYPLRKDYEYPEDYHGIDHYRPDPKEQFAALDDLAKKAAAKAQEKQQQQSGSDSDTPPDADKEALN